MVSPSISKMKKKIVTTEERTDYKMHIQKEKIKK